MRTISFLRKRNGPHPKEKSWRRSGRTLLSPAPSNTVITGMPYLRASRPAALRLSGQDNTLSRAPPDLGTAPQRGADTPRKHHPVPPQAGSRAARFFTSFHGAGRRRVLPQSLAGPFSLAARNRFCLGPPKRNGFGEVPGQGWVFLQTISFLRKRNGPHPKEKSLSGVMQSAPISGAEKYCDHWDVLLPGVTPYIVRLSG